MKIEAIGKPEGCKLLRISADLVEPLGENSRIRSMSIRGDFFATPEEAFDEAERGLVGIRLAELPEKFGFLLKTLGIQAIGITGQGIFDTIKKAIDASSL